MSTLTASEIASCLGLKDRAYERMIADYLLTRNGSKKTPSMSVKERVAKERERIDKMMVVWEDVEHPDFDGLTAEVAHLYLPDSVRAYRLAVAGGLNNPWTSALLLLSSSSSFGRFATRDPSLTTELLETTCQALAIELSLDNLAVMKRPDGTALREDFPAIISFIIGLILHDSNGRYPPRPTPTSSTALLLEKIEAFGLEIRAPSPAFLSILESERKHPVSYYGLLTLVSDMLGKGTLSEDCFYHLKGLDSQQWYRCAGTSKDDQSCRELAEGEEMEACGKCRAVRYCSREHQRAHWKVHKKMCWEPVW